MKSILHHLLFSAAIGIALSLQLGSSCASSASSPDNNSSGPYDNSSNNNGSGNYPDHDRPNRIPRWSDLVGEGSGKLKWTSDLDGDIYVYDASKDHIDYTGPVRRGQEIVVVPDDDKVYVAERVVSNENLRQDSTHQIYFARQRNDYGNHGNQAGIPRNAIVLTEGRDEISSRVRDSGTIYVFDINDNKVMHMQQVRRDQTVTVIPGKDHIDINGTSVYRGNLVRDHAHRIYFVKG